MTLDPGPIAPASAGLVRRLVAFAGLPFLSLITPFLFLPILARVAGAEAWLAIAVGQSAGGFFALVVALGYNTIGPPMVALAAPGERVGIFTRSLQARLVVWLPCVLLAVLVAVLVAPPTHWAEAGLMAVAVSMSGLSAGWFMIGLGRASLIAIYEVAPRIVTTVIAAVVVLAGGQVGWYPLLLVVAAVVSIGTFALRTAPVSRLLAVNRSVVASVLRNNRTAVTTEVAGGAYNSLVVTLVGTTAAATQAAAYVSGDKLYRIGQYSVSSLGNALQGWVVERGAASFARRARTSFLLHLALGLLGFAAFALLGPFLSQALFGDLVAIDLPTALGLGTATIGIALGTALGRIMLVSMGARREFMTSVLVAACVAVPSILVLSATFGAAGGAWGLAIGEVVSVCAQAVSVLVVYRRAGGWVVAAGPTVG